MSLSIPPLSDLAVGLTLKAVRKSLDMSLNELGAVTGMTTSSISRTENGTRRLEFAEADQVCRLAALPMAKFQAIARNFDACGVMKTQKALEEIQQQVRTMTKDKLLELAGKQPAKEKLPS